MLGMRYAAKLKQHPSHPTYDAVFSRSALAVFREGRERRSVPFCIRMRWLFDESDLELHGVTRVTHLSVPPWKLSPPSIDISLSEIKKGEIPDEVFFAPKRYNT